jgi:hypothetical protein
METIGKNAIEVLMTIGLLYGTLKYWNWKLRGGYDISNTNKAYGIFLFGQISCLLFMITNGLDPQNHAYMEHMNLFGEGAFDLWSVLGIQLFGLILLFMLANVIGTILFNVGFQSENGLYEELREENLTAALVASSIIFTVGYTSSFYILRPFILDWVSRNAGLIPLN